MDVFLDFRFSTGRLEGGEKGLDENIIISLWI